MFTRFPSTIAWAAILLVYISALSWAAVMQAPGPKAETGTIRCSVMEAFDDAHLGVRAVVFHQRDKADGPRLGALLLAHSGQDMVLQNADSHRYRATVFRVKSAFGRGLVLIPLGKFKLGEHDEFTLSLPANNR